MKLNIVFKDGRTAFFNGVESFHVTENTAANEESLKPDVIKASAKSKGFWVTPLEIDRSLFRVPRKNPKEEETRQTIVEAFAEVDKHPDLYALPFFNLIPQINWDLLALKTIEELILYAQSLGGIQANWVEQGLVWAQRIFDGESWEKVCTIPDTDDWYKVVIWKNGYARIIGGASRVFNSTEPASNVGSNDLFIDSTVSCTVPSVVIRPEPIHFICL